MVRAPAGATREARRSDPVTDGRVLTDREAGGVFSTGADMGNASAWYESGGGERRQYHRDAGALRRGNLVG